MKRKQVIAVGILSICLFASGCGANKETEAVSQEAAVQETEVVSEAKEEQTEVKDETDITENNAEAEVEEEGFPVSNYEELVSAVNDKNPYIRLTADITLEKRLDIDYPMTLDLGGKTLSVHNNEDDYVDGYASAILVESQGVTIQNGIVFSDTVDKEREWGELDGGILVRDGAGLMLKADVRALHRSVIVGYESDVTVAEGAKVETTCVDHEDFAMTISAGGNNEKAGKITISGTIKGEWGLLVDRQRNVGDKILIDGANIEASFDALDLRGTSEYTIKNSTIFGGTYGVDIGAGDLHISGGTISNGAADTAALAIEENKNNLGVRVIVDEDVELKTDSNYAVSVKGGERVSATINGSLGGKKILTDGASKLEGSAAVEANIEKE